MLVRMSKYFLLIFPFLNLALLSEGSFDPLFSCQFKCTPLVAPNNNQDTTPYLVILGTAQDAGSPQAGCHKPCCASLFANPDRTRKVVSLGLVDPANNMHWLFEATPDMPSQLDHLLSMDNKEQKTAPEGIFITHAHIGHYTGLMYLGKEVMDVQNIPVYGLPRLCSFLADNGPWEQLVTRKNITLKELQPDEPVILNPEISVTALSVPHRDEYSETAAFLIQGPNKSALFIPDIDKWSRWEMDIRSLVTQVDYALLDATFFDANELPGRNMADIPHPFVQESMTLFSSLPTREKNKIIFIHFNHTNPLWDIRNDVSKSVLNEGYRIAQAGTILGL